VTPLQKTDSAIACPLIVLCQDIFRSEAPGNIPAIPAMAIGGLFFIKNHSIYSIYYLARVGDFQMMRYKASHQFLCKIQVRHLFVKPLGSYEKIKY
jgi:hypothetical protein